MKLNQLKWPLLLAVVAALLCSVLLSALSAQQGAVGPRVVMPRESWQPVQPPAVDASAIIADLDARNLWGLPPSAAVAASEPLTKPNWRIMAVVQQGSIKKAILVFDNQLNAPTELKVGDKLPGGYPIVAIDPDYLTIRMHGHNRVLFTTH